MIALDTPTEPEDAADALFATDNFKAGELIGQYAKAKARRRATTPRSPCSTSRRHLRRRLRHDGFLKGFGIKDGDPQIVGAAPTRQGDQAKGQTAMENLLQKDPDINVVYTINEPAGSARANALKAAGKEKDVLIVSVDGGCDAIEKGVKTGVIDATSQQYPLKMAALGVEAGAAAASGGKKPSGYVDTGVTLITRPGRRRRVQGRRLRHRELLGLAATVAAPRRPPFPAGGPPRDLRHKHRPPARRRARASAPPSPGAAPPQARDCDRVAQLGPLIALLLACAFFATRPTGSSPARTSR